MISKKAFLFITLIFVLILVPVKKVSAQFTCSNADINSDGNIDITDYSLLVQNFLKAVFNPKSDINKDGSVDLTDYSLLTQFFLKPCPIASVTPTSTVAKSPTPATGAGNYYVSPTGNDSATGTNSAPFKTIQKAVNATKSDNLTGATIHVMPGIYRETVTFDSIKGTSSDPVTLMAENGQNTVFIYGSQSSADSSITWSKNADGATFPSGVASHIYSATVNWTGTPELAYNTTNGSVRLPKAHEPDFNITTEWKYHENFWTADGADNGSFNTLVDANNDPSGQYPEAAQSQNLKNINGFNTSFLTGARLFFKDGADGHDYYNTVITAHDATAGKITFDKSIQHPAGKAAATQYSKYYVEGAPQLLDTPGEWYYNPSTKKLYIWPPNDVNPASLKLEFATRMNAISIKNSTYLNFKNLNLNYTNYGYNLSTGPEGAIRFYGYTNDQTNNITFDGLKIEHNGVGMRLYQSNESTSSPGQLHHVTLKNSLIDDSDGYAVMVWHWPVPGPTPFIHHLWFENNEFAHMGFRGSGVGIFMQHPEKLVFINNYLHHSGHNAIEVQGGKSSGNTMALVQNNLSENICLNGADCGAWKFYHADGGSGMKNILVTHNIFRGTKGWTYANAAQKKYNNVLGYGYWGNGYYSDVIPSSTPGSGCSVTVFRNLIYDNSSSGIQLTRSRDHCLFNNVLVQNGTGIDMNNYAPTTDGSFNNKVFSNIIMFTEPSSNSTAAKSYGMTTRINKADESKAAIDRNIYQVTGSNSFDIFRQDLVYTNVATWKTTQNIRDNSPWEDNGKDMTGVSVSIGNPVRYDISTIEKLFGINSVSVPSEVQTVTNTLQSEFGMTIPNSTNVGRL